jgi:hypothetical protein
MKLEYIVTGTGRCGTLFMANLLTSMEIPCGHEAIFTTRGMDWVSLVLDGKRNPRSSSISIGDNLSDVYDGELMADSSFMAAPYLKRIDAKVIHVVRNPINVISSMIGDAFRNFENSKPTHFADLGDHHRYEKFIYDNLKDLEKEMPQIDRACLFYVGWNRMIEDSAKIVLRHRIEDEVSEIKKLFSYEGETYENTSCNSFADLNKEWIIDEIESSAIRSELEEMAKKYGY